MMKRIFACILTLGMTIILLSGHNSNLIPAEISYAAEETEGEGENAVTKEVTYKGVYVLKGEQVQFKKIDVIYEGSNYVLSSLDHTGDDSYLVLYDDFMIEGVDE